MFNYLKIFLLLIVSSHSTFGQDFTTKGLGDIENPEVWENNIVPPFIVSSDSLEVPSTITLSINHTLTTSKSYVNNYGNVTIKLLESHPRPSILWKNFGNMTFGGEGWGLTEGHFINQESGKMLFDEGAIFCHQLGCGSENFGTIYVKLCTSNMCSLGEHSGFINHESGTIVICGSSPFSYIENNWVNPLIPGNENLENLTFTNNGEIIIQSENHDVKNSDIASYDGNPAILNANVECVEELSQLMTSINEENKVGNISVKISPNPSNGFIQIENNIPISNLVITNFMGQTLKTINISHKITNKIKLDLPNGQYFLIFYEDRKRIATKRIIVLN